ncbi:uncharacterized protein LOC123205787 [Mangifera indica]|uniref:uncharacterized protein LOC123205787 n=1 Tax=Mangifera indica TaxID=29780 RepID=UPI001CF978C3|nr:uncharacterized protein LOC123205787 [Mangifera indica]
MADRKRSERQFKIGDQVYVKLQPYRQVTMHSGNQKFQPRYFSPFTILDKVGAVAYRLQLPTDAAIHDVFHVSLLRPAYSRVVVSPTLPPQFTPQRWPQCILDRKMVRRRNIPAVKLLIQWPNETHETTIWEFADTIRNQFLFFPLRTRKSKGEYLIQTVKTKG